MNRTKVALQLKLKVKGSSFFHNRETHLYTLKDQRWRDLTQRKLKMRFCVKDTHTHTHKITILPLIRQVTGVC